MGDNRRLISFMDSQAPRCLPGAASAARPLDGQTRPRAQGKKEERIMKKSSKKLTLNRDTLRNLGAPSLEAAAGGAVTNYRCTIYCTAYVSCPQSCGGTCNPQVGTCFFCSVPC
jgi:hypothetical protein